MTEEGWKRRTVASEPRLSEIVEAYERLGFEVRLEPVAPGDPELADAGCTACLEEEGAAETVRVVWTRPARKRGEVAGEEGLFERGGLPDGERASGRHRRG